MAAADRLVGHASVQNIAAANDAAAVHIEAQAQASEVLREMAEPGECKPGHGDR